MRVIAELPENLASWIDETTSVTHMKAIRRQLLGLVPLDFHAKLLASISELRSRGQIEIASRLHDLVQEMPLAFVRDVQPSGVVNGSSLAALVDARSDEFDAMSAHVTAGDSRDQTYEKQIRPFLKFVRRVVIIDRYALDSLWDSTEKVWLINRLIEDSEAVVEVNTAQPEKILRDATSIAGKVETRLKLKESLDDGQLTFNVYRYPHTMHKRLARFEFDQSAVELELDKGLESFSRPVFASADLFVHRVPVLTEQILKPVIARNNNPLKLHFDRD